jgi:predicted nuclease with TOPRIM domain
MYQSQLEECLERIRTLEEEKERLNQQNRRLQQEVLDLQERLRESRKHVETLQCSRSPRLTIEKIVNNDKLVGKIIN